MNSTSKSLLSWSVSKEGILLGVYQSLAHRITKWKKRWQLWSAAYAVKHCVMGEVSAEKSDHVSSFNCPRPQTPSGRAVGCWAQPRLQYLRLTWTEHITSCQQTLCQPHHCCAVTGEKPLGEGVMEEQVLGKSDLLLFITDLGRAQKENSFTEIKPQCICVFCAVMPALVGSWISYFRQSLVYFIVIWSQ